MLIGSTAGHFFDLYRVRPPVNNLSQLVPHARSEFLGERDSFDLQKDAANAPVARTAPPHIYRPPLNRACSKARMTPPRRRLVHFGL
ncbi:hypothetical protein PMIN01_09561 [Paraphaeosphaeria minitans]|uniref:Uncharacterized protein n=1 Tax=Paraphaeosphaeria minitans TaxID=565426 RepID=A0A9P6GCP4_9PLEO|nr:hypothetical protein PMIN01_09561 [Paraphaeosphaeria minitans]